MDEKQKLLQAIALQETLRGVVDDEVIDIAIATLRDRVANLDTGNRSPTTQTSHHPFCRSSRFCGTSI